MDYPKMLVVYIAGRYNATNVIDVGRNIRNGRWIAIKLMDLGFAPYCPFLDFDYLYMTHIEAEMFKQCSMEMLRRSDAMLTLVGWEQSPGTKEEMEEAKKLGIPIFENVVELLEWRYLKEQEGAL